jgi:glucosylceramidase
MNIVTAMFRRTVAMTCAPINAWITTGERVELLESASDVDWATSDVSTGTKSLIRIEPDLHFQEMFGFGAALADASARQG